MYARAPDFRCVYFICIVYICAFVRISTFRETDRLKYIILNTHKYIIYTWSICICTKVIRAHGATFMASYSHGACIEVRQGEVTTYTFIICI